MSAILLATSALNTLYLLTRSKIYRLHQRRDPVSSPNASFVQAHLDFEPLETPPMSTRLWRFCTRFWRWLLDLAPSVSADDGRIRRVQQLEIWVPGDFELSLFCIYSPVHPLLWMVTTSSNWLGTFFAMALVGTLVRLAFNFPYVILMIIPTDEGLVSCLRDSHQG
jgi:hypothetical protein